MLIFLFLFGLEYIDVYKILLIMIWVLLIWFPNYILGHILLSIHRQHTVLVITSITLVLTIILNYTLIGTYGLEGAAYTILFSATIPFIGYLLSMRKDIDIINILLIVGKGIILSFSTIAFGLYFRQLVSVYIHIPLLLILMTILIYASGIINRNTIYGIRKYIYK